MTVLTQLLQINFSPWISQMGLPKVKSFSKVNPLWKCKPDARPNRTLYFLRKYGTSLSCVIFFNFLAWYYFLHLAATLPRPPSRHLRRRRRRPPPPSPHRPRRSAPSCRFQRVPHFRSETSSVFVGRSSKSHLGEVVHPGELEDGGHAVEEGADDEPVQGGGIVHLVEEDAGHRERFQPKNYYYNLILPVNLATLFP